MGLIAIGDIHGCPKTLEELLSELAPATDDRLVFIGDYIDRGPDSKGVIERLMELQKEQPCTFLRGNHEALMLDYLDGSTDGRALRLWQQNGGTSTLRSYANGREARIPKAHVAFARATELYYDTPEFFFVHAGLKADQTIKENLRSEGEHTFLWERDHLEAPHRVWEKPVVCGHTPRREPISRDNLIAIDTGCVYHMHAGLGRLTAVRLPERDFVSVEYAG